MTVDRESASSRTLLRDLAWIAALAAGFAALWVLRVSRSDAQYNVAGGDAFGYFLPAYDYEARRLAQGHVPFWNPYQGVGVPFLGTLQPGAIYPARLLLLLTSPARAMGWSAFAHVLLGAIGTFVLCRRLGTSRAAAAIGAIVFTSAFALPWILTPTQLEPGAWFPLIALAVVEILSTGGWVWVPILGLAAAMPILAGSGQLAVFGAYAVAVVALAMLLEARALPWSRIRRLALAGGLAACTAAPQLLATALWGGESMRPVRALSDLQMMPLMTETARHDQITAFFFRHAPTDLCHLSIPVIALALVGLASGRRTALVLGLAALATATLAVGGPESAAFAVYKALPGVAMFRFPTRLLVLTALFAAVAAAFGTTRLAHTSTAPRRRLLVEAVALAVVVVVLVVPYRVIGMVPWSSGPAYSAPDARFFPGDERPPDAYRVWAPAGRLDLRGGAFVRQGMREGVRVVQDYEPTSSRRLGAFLSVAAGRGTGPADDLVLFTGALLDDPPIARPAMLDVVSVRSIVMPATAVPADPVAGWDEIARRWRYVVERNTRALPRAYLVERARFVRDETAALDTIADPAFDAHAEAVLVGDVTERAVDEAGARTLADAPATPATAATIALDEPERVVVDVAPARASVLVVTDAFAPGWDIHVDGMPRRLWQANYLVRGVLVAPGDRRVELRYAAPGFASGVALAGLAWAAVAVASAAVFWQKGAWRRRPGRGHRARSASAASS